MSDPVRPDHYTSLDPEPITIIESWGLGFNLGNCLKYIARAGRKTPDAVADLKKAAWYLSREIDRLGGPSREAVRGPYKGMRLVAAVQIVLESSGEKSMTACRIAEQLLAGGYESKNPAGLRNCVYSSMYRWPTVFSNPRPGHWVLAGNAPAAEDMPEPP